MMIKQLNLGFELELYHHVDYPMVLFYLSYLYGLIESNNRLYLVKYDKSFLKGKPFNKLKKKKNSKFFFTNFKPYRAELTWRNLKKNSRISKENSSTRADSQGQSALSSNVLANSLICSSIRKWLNTSTLLRPWRADSHRDLKFLKASTSLKRWITRNTRIPTKK